MIPTTETLPWTYHLPGAERHEGMSFLYSLRVCKHTWIGTHEVKVLVAQSRLTFCDRKDCSPPGSSIRGFLQARILERVAISSSRGSF